MKNTKTNKLHKFAVVGACALMAVVNLSMNSQSFASRDLASNSDLRDGLRAERSRRSSSLRGDRARSNERSVRSEVRGFGEVDANVNITDSRINYDGNIEELENGDSFTLRVVYDTDIKVGNRRSSELSDSGSTKTITITRKEDTSRVVGNNPLAPATVNTEAYFVASLADCNCTVQGETATEVGEKIQELLEEAAEASAKNQLADEIIEERREKFAAAEKRFKGSCSVRIVFDENSASGYERINLDYEERLSCLSDNAVDSYYDGNIPRYTQQITNLFNTCLSRSRSHMPYMSEFSGHQFDIAFSSRTSPLIMNFDDPYAQTSIYQEDDLTSSYCQEALTFAASVDETGYADATLKNLESYTQLQSRFDRERGQLNRWRSQQNRVNPQGSDITNQQYQNALEGLRAKYGQYIDYNVSRWEQAPQSYGSNGMIQQWNTIGMTFDQMDQRLNSGISLRADNRFYSNDRFSNQDLNSQVPFRQGRSERAWRGSTNNRVNTFNQGNNRFNNSQTLNNSRSGLRGNRI